ncbi:unnamed protein product [Arctia plantaginis]|uniref:TIL domain-containing protein n=1 Tax=Arctia plantaginis TaxID=874455 RepID=A0A8S0ZRK3_ARCPL|nr:unnamed protein product [Arctia plantaginis]
MEPRVIAGLFVLLYLCCPVYAQVASLCRPKEQFLMCGCQKTCRNPAVDCSGVCKIGCYCQKDEYRNDEGLCVKLADCPPIKSAFTQETSEPRENEGKCPENEEYRFCEPCAKSCENPNPICPAQCMRGCFCVEGMLRNDKGLCVKPDKCQNLTTPQPIVYQMTCNSLQVYKQCETCERTCSDPNPKCPSPCKTGCFCEQDYVKGPDGQCMKLENCPKAEMTFGVPGSPTIEDCAPDEEYFSCGWCEPSCSHPNPSCPNKVCTTGCLCRPPLLRHHSGHCVEEKDCIPQKCTHQNEEFVCRYGCELRCEPRRFHCAMRTRRCILGCHCKLGLYRDSFNGNCVTKEQCGNATVSSFTAVKNTIFSVFNYSEPDVTGHTPFKIDVD